MQVHLLRHGAAENFASTDTDAMRKLTTAGRDQLWRALECARHAEIAPTVILTSPYARAIETAEIAAAVFHYRGNIVKTDALLPVASPEQVWDELRSRQNEEQILLAGHEPLMSQLVAYLLGAPPLQIDMQTATLVRIDIARFTGEPRGTLCWILP